MRECGRCGECGNEDNAGGVEKVGDREVVENFLCRTSSRKYRKMPFSAG
jgi:hypothetical protein